MSGEIIFSPAFTVQHAGGDILVDVDNEASTMSYSDWAFGFSISGAVVTVKAGKVRHGVRTPILVGSTAVTIAADQTWVFVSYPYGSGAATIASSTTEPVDDAGTHNHALFLVTLTGGVASVEAGNIRHLGDIWLPSNVG